jgi:DNA-binding NtrC family response regulator
MTQEMIQESMIESVIESDVQTAPEQCAPAATTDEIIPLLIGTTVDRVERELVLHTLVRCNGNRTRAARMLGFSIRTLRNRIRLYTAEGIDVPAHCD